MPPGMGGSYKNQACLACLPAAALYRTVSVCLLDFICGIKLLVQDPSQDFVQFR